MLEEGKKCNRYSSSLFTFGHFNKIFNDIWTKLEGRDFVLNIFFNLRTDVSYSFFVCFRYRMESGPGPSRMDNLDFFWISFGLLNGLFSRILYVSSEDYVVFWLRVILDALIVTCFNKKVRNFMEYSFYIYKRINYWIKQRKIYH